MKLGHQPKTDPVETLELDEAGCNELVFRKGLIEQRLNLIEIHYRIAICVFLILSSAGILVARYNLISDNTRVSILLIFGVILIGVAFHVLLKFSESRTLRDQMRELSFQIDLAKDEVDQIEGRAEKILNMSSYQIKQYHDFNLRHNRRVFILGSACIGAGIFVVLLALAIVMMWAENVEEKVLVSVLGAIGSILSNFVGAIYLVMHRSAADVLREFHNKLVESHRMLLGNLLASRITEKTKREDVLAKLALELISKSKTGKPLSKSDSNSQ